MRILALLWFGLNIQQIAITSRQGNNEEQAHTKNKGTNEHDWKKQQSSSKQLLTT
jgi:hypothetical protein